MVTSVVLVAGLLSLAMSKRALVPGRSQSVAELLYEFVAGMIRSTAGDAGLKFFPFVFTLFAFILMGNMLGMFPYFPAPGFHGFTFTSHIIVTFALALVVMAIVIGYGVFKHGLKFFSLFFPSGVPWPLYILLTPIEIISFLSRPVTLGVRLFANMLAGHILLKVFAGFIIMLGSVGALGVLGAVAPLIMVVALTASAFVLYDPHVIRDTIWASRRYVVAAVPAAIILAGLAAHRFGQRSALAGALVWALLISSVVAGRPALSGGTSWQASPAPKLWNEPFYRGTYDQLGELAELLSADSVLLIDERLARYILGTPLWLIHDRPSVPVLTRSKRGRNAVAWLVRLLDQERELFLVKPTLGANNETIPFVKSRLTSTLTLQTLRPERTEGWPEQGIRYTMPISLFRLEPVILQVQPEDR